MVHQVDPSTLARFPAQLAGLDHERVHKLGGALGTGSSERQSEAVRGGESQPCFDFLLNDV